MKFFIILLTVMLDLPTRSLKTWKGLRKFLSVKKIAEKLWRRIEDNEEGAWENGWFSIHPTN